MSKNSHSRASLRASDCFYILILDFKKKFKAVQARTGKRQLDADLKTENHQKIFVKIRRWRAKLGPVV